MEKTVTNAITSLAVSADTAKDSGDAMRFSQAALNLAHVLATISNIKK